MCIRDSPILLTYNHKLKSSITGLTPNEAKKPDNNINVKIKLELHSKHKRKYPEISIGDSVRVFRKRKHLIKRESIDGRLKNILLKQ